MPGTGRIVVLNGVSSAGKTTLAEAFCARQAAAGDLWLRIGIDDFLARLPAEWQGVPTHVGRLAADGFRFEPTDQGLVVRAGEVGRRLMRAYHGSVAAIARAGVNVLVDEVVFDHEQWQSLTGALAGLDVVWVAVYCDVDEAERRAARRGDRFAGLARAQHRVVHEYARYEIEVDTTSSSVTEVLARLTDQLAQRRRPLR